MLLIFVDQGVKLTNVPQKNTRNCFDILYKIRLCIHKLASKKPLQRPT